MLLISQCRHSATMLAISNWSHQKMPTIFSFNNLPYKKKNWSKTNIDSIRGDDEEGFPSKIRDFLNLFDRHSWTLEKAHVPDHSHQPNTNQWDCGLFVLFYSDFVLQKKKIGFNEAWVSASRNYIASCMGHIEKSYSSVNSKECPCSYYCIKTHPIITSWL